MNTNENKVVKYHLTPDGPKKCVAYLRKCIYDRHYDSFEEAYEACERSFAPQSTDFIPKLSKETKNVKAFLVPSSSKDWDLDSMKVSFTFDGFQVKDASFLSNGNDRAAISLNRSFPNEEINGRLQRIVNDWNVKSLWSIKDIGNPRARGAIGSIQIDQKYVPRLKQLIMLKQQDYSLPKEAIIFNDVLDESTNELIIPVQDSDNQQRTLDKANDLIRYFLNKEINIRKADVKIFNGKG